jgi:CheY-like chemotaxis protein
MKSIIFADDDYVTRTILETILNSLNIPFYACKDGKHAYDIILNNSFYYDIIIADFNMPNMDGCELFMKVRHSLKINTPFVMMSSTPEDQIIAVAGAKCFDYYISKPLNFKKIKDIISKLEEEKAIRKKYLGE